MNNYLKLNELKEHPEYELVYNKLEGQELVDDFTAIIKNYQADDFGFILELYTVFLCTISQTPIPINKAFNILVPKKYEDYGVDILLETEDIYYCIQSKFRNDVNTVFDIKIGGKNDMGTFINECYFLEDGKNTKAVIWTNNGKASSKIERKVKVVNNLGFFNNRGFFLKFLTYVKENKPLSFEPIKLDINFKGIAKLQNERVIENLQYALKNNKEFNSLVCWSTGVGKSVQLSSNVNTILEERDEFNILIGVPRLNLSSQMIEKSLGKFTKNRNFTIINYNSLGKYFSSNFNKVIECTKNEESLGKILLENKRNIIIYAYASEDDLSAFIEKVNLKFDACFYDEFHMRSSFKMYSKINIAYTATPNSSTFKIFKEKYEINIREAVESGYVILPCVHTPKFLAKGNRLESELRAVMEISKKHNKILVTVENSIDIKKFVDKIDCEEIKAYGISSRQEELDTVVNQDFRGSNTGDIYRSDNEVLADFSKQDKAIIFHHSKIGVGTDIDGLEACIVLRNIEEPKSLLQLLGRVTRLHPEDRTGIEELILKRECSVYDYKEQRKDFKKAYGHFYIPIINEEELNCKNLFGLLVKNIGLDFVVAYLDAVPNDSSSMESEEFVKQNSNEFITEAILKEFTDSDFSSLEDLFMKCIKDKAVILQDKELLIKVMLTNDLSYEVYSLLYNVEPSIFDEYEELLTKSLELFIKKHNVNPQFNKRGKSLENKLYEFNKISQ